MGFLGFPCCRRREVAVGRFAGKRAWGSVGVMARDEKGVEDVIPTTTLARLYEKQGLLREAAAVYKELLRVEPGREALQKALTDIETRLRGQKPQTLSKEVQTVLSQLQRWRQVVFSRRQALVRHTEPSVRVLVIQGPDVASVSLGEAPERSGKITAEETEACIRRVAGDFGIIVDFFRADDEKAFIRRIREAAGGYEALVIDSGGEGGHCPGSGARDAIGALDIPIVLVHPVNALREGLCSEPGLEDVVTAHLAGFGREGYGMALRAAARMARPFVEARAGGVRRET